MASPLPIPTTAGPAIRHALALALVLVAALAPAHGATTGDLRRELEQAYNQWRLATVQRDYPRWHAATSPYRQAMTRNLIVSQKLPWPQALFEIPVTPPEITQLRLLAARQRGNSALLAYIGPVDFGVVEGDLPENVLIIHFHRSDDRWRFDRTQFVNLGANPDVAKEARAGQTDFLDRPPYRLPDHPPPVPQLCPKPLYVGHIRIESVGYETTVRLNDPLHQSTARDNTESTVVIGGLRRNENRIRIDTRPIDSVPDADRRFAVSVFATSDPATREPARVFHYQPTDPPPPSLSTSVWVTPSTLRGR